MATNGFVTLFYSMEGDQLDTDEIREYIDYLNEFSSDRGKSYLSEYKEAHPEKYKRLSESDKRNFRNWASGKNIPERKKLIKLCFALEIRELDAINELMYAFNYDALHMRDVEELCYYFALKHNIPYKEAELLAECEKKRFNDAFGEQAGEQKRTETGLYTSAVVNCMDMISTISELRDYIDDNRSMLGNIKVTAYKKFKVFLDKMTCYNKVSLFENEGAPDELIKSIYTSMGFHNHGGMEKYKWQSALNRTESISRGLFILYAVDYIMKSRVGSVSIGTADFVSLINNALDECTFARLDPERCLWDKIVYDCLDAEFDGGLYEEDSDIEPYALLRGFLDYIQEPEN